MYMHLFRRMNGSSGVISVKKYGGTEVEKREDLSSLLPKWQLSLPKARLEKNVAVQRKDGDERVIQ